MAALSLESLTAGWSLSSGLLMVLALLVLCVFVYYMLGAVSYYRKVQNIGQITNQLPGPPTRWLTGNLHLLPGFNEEMLEWLQGEVRAYPYLSRFWFGPLRPTVMVTHPDTIKVILRSTEPKQMMGGGAYSLIKPWLGDGLLLSSGDKWFRNRRLLTPAFHFDVLKPYVDIYNHSAEALLEKFSGEYGRPSNIHSVEITKHITMCTLAIIMKCAMSYKEDIQRQGQNNPYASAVFNISKLLSSRALKPYLYIDALYYLTGEGRQFRSELKRLHDFSEKVIAERKKQLKDNPDFKTKRYPDFLDILLLARDDDGVGLTDHEIRDEVDTFMFEGHDTTSSAISWIIYTIAGHPSHQAKCRQELQDLMRGRPSHYIEWNDLSRMPYLTMCIKEAIRIHSPVHWIGREVQKPFELYGLTLRPGTLVDISIYGLHHNPMVWGEDHNEFKPERFEPETFDKMDSFAFVPFSAGPRNCIGQNFAMNEIKVALARVLLKYELRVDEQHTVRHLPEVVMRTETGMKLFFDPITAY